MCKLFTSSRVKTEHVKPVNLPSENNNHKKMRCTKVKRKTNNMATDPYVAISLSILESLQQRRVDEAFVSVMKLQDLEGPDHPIVRSFMELINDHIRKRNEENLPTSEPADEDENSTSESSSTTGSDESDEEASQIFASIQASISAEKRKERL